jgi:hypothetical protein
MESERLTPEQWDAALRAKARREDAERIPLLAWAVFLAVLVPGIGVTVYAFTRMVMAAFG